MNQPADSSRAKEAIIEAAITLFGKRGYTGTTMRDIAREVGILPGSLYAHIDSKETLLDEIVELGIESFLATEATLDNSATAVARLRAAIKAHAKIAAENPGRSLVVFHQWRFLTDSNLTRALNKRRRYQQIFVKIVDDGITDRSFDPGLDTKAAVFTILGALNWIPEWYSPTGHFSSSEIGDKIADILIKGLLNRG